MPTVAQDLAALQAKGVNVVVIELHGNLGQAGLRREQFAHRRQCCQKGTGAVTGPN